MPPKVKFTREEIIRSALDIVRETGPEGLTARSLAARLGCSVKPIFGLFRSMEEVQQEVLAAGYRLYGQTIAQAMEAGKYPPYKASGMAYIAFAQPEQAFRTALITTASPSASHSRRSLSITSAPICSAGSRSIMSTRYRGTPQQAPPPGGW